MRMSDSHLDIQEHSLSRHETDCSTLGRRMGVLQAYVVSAGSQRDGPRERCRINVVPVHDHVCPGLCDYT